MAHTYRIYDVDGSGNKHDTGKVVIVKELPTFYPGSPLLQTHGSLVADLFTLFGFTEYMTYYRPRKSPSNPDDLAVWYTYLEGERMTWYLARGT